MGEQAKRLWQFALSQTFPLQAKDPMSPETNDDDKQAKVSSLVALSCMQQQRKKKSTQRKSVPSGCRRLLAVGRNVKGTIISLFVWLISFFTHLFSVVTEAFLTHNSPLPPRLQKGRSARDTASKEERWKRQEETHPYQSRKRSEEEEGGEAFRLLPVSSTTRKEEETKRIATGMETTDAPFTGKSTVKEREELQSKSGRRAGRQHRQKRRGGSSEKASFQVEAGLRRGREDGRTEEDEHAKQVKFEDIQEREQSDSAAADSAAAKDTEGLSEVQREGNGFTQNEAPYQHGDEIRAEKENTQTSNSPEMTCTHSRGTCCSVSAVRLDAFLPQNPTKFGREKQSFEEHKTQKEGDSGLKAKEVCFSLEETLGPGDESSCPPPFLMGKAVRREEKRFEETATKKGEQSNEKKGKQDEKQRQVTGYYVMKPNLKREENEARKVPSSGNGHQSPSSSTAPFYASRACGQKGRSTRTSAGRFPSFGDAGEQMKYKGDEPPTVGKGSCPRRVKTNPRFSEETRQSTMSTADSFGSLSVSLSSSLAVPGKDAKDVCPKETCLGHNEEGWHFVSARKARKKDFPYPQRQSYMSAVSNTDAEAPSSSPRSSHIGEEKNDSTTERQGKRLVLERMNHSHSNVNALYSAESECLKLTETLPHSPCTFLPHTSLWTSSSPHASPVEETTHGRGDEHQQNKIRKHRRKDVIGKHAPSSSSLAVSSSTHAASASQGIAIPWRWCDLMPDDREGGCSWEDGEEAERTDLLPCSTELKESVTCSHMHLQQIPTTEAKEAGFFHERVEPSSPSFSGGTIGGDATPPLVQETKETPRRAVGSWASSGPRLNTRLPHSGHESHEYRQREEKIGEHQEGSWERAQNADRVAETEPANSYWPSLGASLGMQKKQKLPNHRPARKSRLGFLFETPSIPSDRLCHNRPLPPQAPHTVANNRPSVSFPYSSSSLDSGRDHYSPLWNATPHLPSGHETGETVWQAKGQKGQTPRGRRFAFGKGAMNEQPDRISRVQTDQPRRRSTRVFSYAPSSLVYPALGREREADSVSVVASEDCHASDPLHGQPTTSASPWDSPLPCFPTTKSRFGKRRAAHQLDVCIPNIPPPPSIPPPPPPDNLTFFAPPGTYASSLYYAHMIGGHADSFFPPNGHVIDPASVHGINNVAEEPNTEEGLTEEQSSFYQIAHQQKAMLQYLYPLALSHHSLYPPSFSHSQAASAPEMGVVYYSQKTYGKDDEKQEGDEEHERGEKTGHLRSCVKLEEPGSGGLLPNSHLEKYDHRCDATKSHVERDGFSSNELSGGPRRIVHDFAKPSQSANTTRNQIQNRVDENDTDDAKNTNCDDTNRPSDGPDQPNTPPMVRPTLRCHNRNTESSRSDIVLVSKTKQDTNRGSRDVLPTDETMASMETRTPKNVNSARWENESDDCYHQSRAVNHDRLPGGGGLRNTDDHHVRAQDRDTGSQLFGAETTEEMDDIASPVQTGDDEARKGENPVPSGEPVHLKIKQTEGGNSRCEERLVESQTPIIVEKDDPGKEEEGKERLDGSKRDASFVLKNSKDPEVMQQPDRPSHTPEVPGFLRLLANLAEGATPKENTERHCSSNAREGGQPGTVDDETALLSSERRIGYSEREDAGSLCPEKGKFHAQKPAETQRGYRDFATKERSATPSGFPLNSGQFKKGRNSAEGHRNPRLPFGSVGRTVYRPKKTTAEGEEEKMTKGEIHDLQKGKTEGEALVYHLYDPATCTWIEIIGKRGVPA